MVTKIEIANSLMDDLKPKRPVDKAVTKMLYTGRVIVLGKDQEVLPDSQLAHTTVFEEVRWPIALAINTLNKMGERWGQIGDMRTEAACKDRLHPIEERTIFLKK